MCGRYNIIPNAQAFVDAFGILDGIEALPDKPRYNIAPSGDPVPVIRQSDRGRELCQLRWPLLPHWAKEGRIKFASYYEWKKGGERKQPYHIQMPGRALFAFGGLWDRCETDDGETIESCTIITTAPSPALQAIHNRMPLIIPPHAYDHWLSGDEPERRIQPFDGDVELYPVSTFVNNPRHDGPRCVEKVH